MSKSLNIHYFAIFREHAGTGEETVNLEANTAGEVFALLMSRHRSAEPLNHCKVAINGEMSDWSAAVHDGDTLLFFPPVAGG